jgi:hypothetical protein|tara:strand:+ start:491 stop:673 length:183 start_codon:yes stop_codon:yes gene_type:complete
MTDFYTFTVEIEKKKNRKQPPTVCIRFFGCKDMDDANKLAEHLNIMLNTDMIAIEGESLH